MYIISSSTRPTLPNTRDPRIGSLNNILTTSLNGATRASDYNKDKLSVKNRYVGTRQTSGLLMRETSAGVMLETVG